MRLPRSVAVLANTRRCCRRSKAQLEIEAIQAKLKTMEDEKAEAKAKTQKIMPTSLKRKLDEASHC